MTISVVVAGAYPSCVGEAQQILARMPGVRVVANAGSRDRAATLIHALQPDVVVVDLALLSLSDHFLAGWGDVSRATRFVVIGRDEHAGCARRLLAQGVTAYVPSSEMAERLGPVVLNGAGTSSSEALHRGRPRTPAPTDMASEHPVIACHGDRDTAGR